MLEELAQRLQEGVRSGIAEFNEVVQKTEARAGKNLAQYVKAAAAEIREELQRDIENARVHAAEMVDEVNRAHSRPVIAKWMVVGLITGMIFVRCGSLDRIALGLTKDAILQTASGLFAESFGSSIASRHSLRDR